jgi:hypothetical protein
MTSATRSERCVRLDAMNSRTPPLSSCMPIPVGSVSAWIERAHVRNARAYAATVGIESKTHSFTHTALGEREQARVW